MNVYGGEFVAVAFVDGLSHASEMLRNLGRTLLNYRDLFIAQLFQEKLVKFKIVKKRRRLVHILVLGQWRDCRSKRLVNFFVSRHVSADQGRVCF